MRCLVMVTVVSLALGGLARADLLTHVLEVGDADGGGNGSAAQDPADLIAWAGAPRPITLGQLLQVAVRESPALKSATLDIEVANAQIQESQANHDWNIQAQSTGQRTAGFFSGIAIPSSDTYTLSGDLTRQLPTNGTLDLHVSTELSKGSTLNPITGRLVPYRNWFNQVSATLTQPLLKGRGTWLYRANEDKAELSHDIAVLARRQTAISLVETVVSGYWDLVLAERQVAITQASLQLARERLRVTELGVRGGKTAQAEVPAVLQIIATRQGDMLSGQLAVLNASFALRRTIGMPIGPGDLALRVDEGLDIDQQTPSLAALLDRAYAASPQLAELAGQDKNATIDIEVNDNGMLPQLDAQVSVGPIGQDSNLPDGSGGTFGNAATNLAELKSIAFSGSLTFSRSVERSQVIGRSRELRATREKIRVNAADVRAQIAQQMAQAVAQLELAKRRVALADQAIQLANENIRIETDRFNLGRSTNFDVLNRLEDERQAELTKAQAEVDWHKARVTVLALTGEILPAYGITVD
jgi:outer membrane protein TolC